MTVVPHLEKLAREGDVGRRKITQYTRYLTVIICTVQGAAMALTLQSGGYFGSCEVIRIWARFCFAHHDQFSGGSPVVDVDW